jgi:transposase
MAAIGEIGRFPSPRKLTGYLGLDPRVRQSGAAPATHGRISKQGSGAPRHALVEASWSVVRQPGPLHAFYARIRARRGHSVAIVACARKLACLFWCLLSREEDYAYQQPSLTAKKLRLLEIHAGAKTHKGIYTGTPGELPGSVLRVGSENDHLVRRERAVRRELVALGCAGVHFRERAAAFPKRRCATASHARNTLTVLA